MREKSPRSASSTRAPEPDVGSTPLPPSFRGKSIPASIEYTLTVRIQRRLRSDTTIKTDVLFVPSTVADAASSKRQMAYAAGTVSPGPYQDPEGWVALPSATIRGEVNERPIQIDCTLHLVESRSYCRGATIPCYLTFSSDDPHSFRLICNPKMPLVRLVRRLQQFEPRKIQPQSSNSVTPFRDEGAEYSNFESILTRSNIVTQATWRSPSKDVLERLDYNSYYLEGEIHLQENLQPSYSSRLFTIEYYVELLPLFSNIFKTSPVKEETKDEEGILVSSFVSITTLRTPGEPAPVTFSEPSVYAPNLFEEAPKEPKWNNQALEQFGLI